MLHFVSSFRYEYKRRADNSDKHQTTVSCAHRPDLQEHHIVSPSVLCKHTRVVFPSSIFLWVKQKVRSIFLLDALILSAMQAHTQHYVTRLISRSTTLFHLQYYVNTHVLSFPSSIVVWVKQNVSSIILLERSSYNPMKCSIADASSLR